MWDGVAGGGSGDWGHLSRDQMTQGRVEGPKDEEGDQGAWSRAREAGGDWQ